MKSIPSALTIITLIILSSNVFAESPKNEVVQGSDAVALYKKIVNKKVMKIWKPKGDFHNEKVTISFNIYPQGNIDQPVIKKSSGVERFDTLALRVISQSTPFPKFPELLKASSLNISIHFKYNSGKAVEERGSAEEKRLADLELRPIKQQEFIDVISTSREEFHRANNDLKRSFSRHKRKKKIKEFIGKNYSVNNWIGVVGPMSTTHNGNAIVTVKIFGDDKIELSNFPKASIPIGSELFVEFMKNSIGDKIRFNGHFISSKTEIDHIREESITEYDSMDNPEFSFIFTDAGKCKKCQNLKDINSTNEDVSLDTKDAHYVSYFAHIKHQIERVWEYPGEAAKQGINGKLNLRFVVSMDGNLISTQVVNKSGYEILDSAAIKAVKEAAPFQPFPIHIKKDKLSILATFIYDPNYK